MTQKDYAKREGLTLSVFYGWSGGFQRQSKADSNFHPVAVTPDQPAEYRLCFPNGLILEWSGQPDVEQLSQLVKELR